MIFGMARSTTLSYVAVKLFPKNSNLCDHNTKTLQTDEQTTCHDNTALCRASRGKNATQLQKTLHGHLQAMSVLTCHLLIFSINS